MAKITTQFADKAAAGDGAQKIHWDDNLKGFGLRVMPGGTKTYLVTYNTVGGKQRRMSLGRHGPLTAAIARRMALRVLGEVIAGGDPMAERRAARNVLTFEGLVALYLKHHASGMKTCADEERRIRKELIPAFGSTPAAEISRYSILARAYEIRDRGAPVQANRVISTMSRIYSFAMQAGLVGASPAAGLGKVAVETPRDRYLSEAEIRVFWADAEIHSLARIADTLKLILVTAQRPGEVAGMKWAEIEGDWWTVPAERAKNGRLHRVPLSPLALSILAERPSQDFSEYVFPANGGYKPLATGAISRAVTHIRSHSGAERWTPHDLRRTAATHIARLGFGSNVGAILNHAPQGTTRRIYDQYNYDAEKRLALNTWGDEINRLLSASDGKVLPMAR